MANVFFGAALICIGTSVPFFVIYYWSGVGSQYPAFIVIFGIGTILLLTALILVVTAFAHRWWYGRPVRPERND